MSRARGGNQILQINLFKAVEKIRGHSTLWRGVARPLALDHPMSLEICSAE
jgi:hypothetical protein